MTPLHMPEPVNRVLFAIVAMVSAFVSSWLINSIIQYDFQYQLEWPLMSHLIIAVLFFAVYSWLSTRTHLFSQGTRFMGYLICFSIFLWLSTAASTSVMTQLMPEFLYECDLRNLEEQASEMRVAMSNTSAKDEDMRQVYKESLSRIGQKISEMELYACTDKRALLHLGETMDSISKAVDSGQQQAMQMDSICKKCVVGAIQKIKKEDHNRELLLKNLNYFKYPERLQRPEARNWRVLIVLASMFLQSLFLMFLFIYTRQGAAE